MTRAKGVAGPLEPLRLRAAFRAPAGCGLATTSWPAPDVLERAVPMCLVQEAPPPPPRQDLRGLMMRIRAEFAQAMGSSAGPPQFEISRHTAKVALFTRPVSNTWKN